MPIPKIKSGETEKDYIPRCMRAQEGEDKDQDQKLAICFDTFRESKKAEKAEGGTIHKQEGSGNGVGVTGKTTVDGSNPHDHTFMTVNGNGMTIDTIDPSGKETPHIHEIVDAIIQPTGSDNHGHKFELID